MVILELVKDGCWSLKLILSWIDLKLVFSRQGERLLGIVVGTWWIRYGFYWMFRWVFWIGWYFFGWIRESVGWDWIGCWTRTWEVWKASARKYWVWSKVYDGRGKWGFLVNFMWVCTGDGGEPPMMDIEWKWVEVGWWGDVGASSLFLCCMGIWREF